MAAQKLVYDDGEVVMREGIVYPHMYMVLRGKVILYSNYGTEAESVICICGVNRIFGELGPLAGAESIYTAVAYGDTLLAAFDESNLSIFCVEYPRYAMNVMRSLANMNLALGKNLDMANQELAKYHGLECRESEKEKEDRERSQQLKERMAKVYMRNNQSEKRLKDCIFLNN